MQGTTILFLVTPKAGFKDNSKWNSRPNVTTPYFYPTGSYLRDNKEFKCTA